MEIEELIKSCQNNDAKAYEVLYKKYYRVLYGITLRYCRTSAEAEDVLQDSFIKIFQNITSYKNEGSFEGWLKHIVRNTSINYYRSQVKFNQTVSLSSENYDIGNDSFNDILDSFSTNEILKQLNNLPEGYRLVVNLYCIDGYTHKEIGEMLNISAGTSKSQLFKAREYLKKAIEPKEKILIA